MAEEQEYRVERDTMGEVRVPAGALWRAQTQRAVENFPISGRGLEPAPHRRARADQGRGRAGQRRAGRAGRGGRPRRSPPPRPRSPPASYDDQFPIDVFQTGSGTSSNMNANEVIATLASPRAGPAGAPQRRRERLPVAATTCSPPSIHLAATAAVTHDLLPALRHLQTTLEAKGTSSATVVKAGRTHLMDATPVTLGQEFSGYAAQVRVRRRAAGVAACPGWPSCRWAVPRWAPA